MKNKKLWIGIGIVVIIGIVVLGTFKNRQQGNAENVLKIGAILPLTGSYSSEGVRGQCAMQMAMDEINKSSESDYVIKLMIEDDKYTGKDSLNAANKILLQGVDAFVSFGTPPTQAIKERIDHIGIPLLAMDGSEGLAASSKWIFECFPPLYDVGSSAGKFTAQTYSSSKVALFTMHCSGGNDFARGFKEQINGECIHDEFDTEATDVRSQISKLLSFKPDIFCVFGYGSGYTTVMKQLLDSGFSGVIITDSNITSVLDKLVFSNHEIYFVSQNYGPASSSKICHDFMSIFRERYGMEPTVFSAHLYEMIKMLAVAAKGSNKDKETIRTALANMHDFPSMFGPVSFDDSGSIHLPFSVMRVKENSVIELVVENIK